MIFCFGSNEAGIHGAGAAKAALSKGAIMHQGFGPAGLTFAIPTKDWRIQTLPIEAVEHYVDRFIEYALHQTSAFQVTAIGCGLAGFKHHQIAPLFKHAPPNCLFDELWAPYLPGKRTWGSFG